MNTEPNWILWVWNGKRWEELDKPIVKARNIGEAKKILYKKYPNIYKSYKRKRLIPSIIC